MNILLLISDFNRGGAERTAALLANEWVASGHAVTLMPTYSGPISRAYPLLPDVRFAPLVDATGPSPTVLRKLALLRRTIAGGKFDVVCSFLTNVNMMAIVAAAGTGVPVVISERVFPPAYPLGLATDLGRRILYRAADRIVMQTEEGFGWLTSIGLEKQGRVIANPISIPLPDHAPFVDPEHLVPRPRRVLLSVGRFETQKRFDWLVRAFSCLKSEFTDWDLALVGEGSQKPHIERLIEELDLASRIICPGPVGNLGDWYRRADAFALVSAFEGFPNVLAEALAHGVPSLAIDCPSGPRELAGDPRIALLLDRGTQEPQLVAPLRNLMAGNWPEKETAARDLRIKLDVAAIARKWVGVFEESAA